MITKDFVIIPVVHQSLVQVGIGSVSINRRGEMNFVIGVDSFGKTLQAQFRAGRIRAIQISVVES